jgi:ribosomal-protein-alanine N-acetyltransferase
MMTIPYPESLQTHRLSLSRVTEEDFPELLVMHQDPRVMATLGGLRPLTELQARHQRNVEHWREHGFGAWVARSLSDGRFVGRGGLRRVVIDGKEEVEVGYGLVPEFWGQGLATELAVASVRAGFEVLQLPEIVSFTLPTNKKSRRVMGCRRSPGESHELLASFACGVALIERPALGWDGGSS